MIRTLTLISTLFMAFGLTAVAATDYARQKVVYHISENDPDYQALALRNMANHIDAVGEDKIDLKVVAHGRGLAMLLKPEAAARTGIEYGNATEEMRAKIAALKSRGVVFKVCARTLKHRGINYQGDLYDVSQKDIVPSGVAELARLQAMGYTYIKP